LAFVLPNSFYSFLVNVSSWAEYREEHNCGLALFHFLFTKLISASEYTLRIGADMVIGCGGAVLYDLAAISFLAEEADSISIVALSSPDFLGVTHHWL
jgi:hypothetical protein